MAALQGKSQTAKASLDIVPILIDYLERDGIAILPMATVYVFAVHAGRPAAIAALRHLKGFGDTQPLALLTRRDRAHEVVNLNHSAERMMSHFPYPITMIVSAKPHLEAGIACGFSDIFVTCPDQFIYDLVGTLPFHLACAAVKIATQPITNFKMAVRYFAEQVDLIIDGGESCYARSGTLIDFTLETPTIMNFGPVSVDDLRPLLPEIILPSHLMK